MLENSPRPPDPVELVWSQEFENQPQVGCGIGRVGFGQLGAEEFEHSVVGWVGQRVNLNRKGLLGGLGN